MSSVVEKYSGKVTPVGNSKGIRLDAAFFKAHPEFEGEVRVDNLRAEERRFKFDKEPPVDDADKVLDEVEEEHRKMKRRPRNQAFSFSSRTHFFCWFFCFVCVFDQN